MLPQDASSPVPDPRRPSAVPRLGGTMKRLRVAKGLTLQQLAEASGVSVGMLSQIERDRANPSLRVLCQVRDALGASMSELFAEPVPAAADPAFVCRAASRPVLELGYLRKELLSRAGPGPLQLMVLVLPPRSTSDTLSTPHEKAGLVLAGALVLAVGNETADLSEGDSFLFDGATPHRLRNPGDDEARILWVMAARPHDRQL